MSWPETNTDLLQKSDFTMAQPVSSGEADHSQQFHGENSRDAPRNGGYDSG
jgi:hypothetical protein